MTVCKKCNGTGEIIVPVVGTMLYGKQQCDECNGTGEVNTTNEEWFCQLPTEEKARWLYDHYVNARADEYYGRQEKTLSEYQKWLVDVHRGIDGTKID